MIKFSHLADCHIGSWREDKLKDLSIGAFRKAIDKSIEENVDFILIAGDLFDNALPNIDLIKEVAGLLKKTKDNKISTFIVPGSHDFSVSGKTMIDVLEKAGLVENVVKLNENNLDFTLHKTKNEKHVKITGLHGKKSGLEKYDYESLNKELLEKEDGLKIFMFHTTINEFKPKDLEKLIGIDVKILPNNFHYYAGGHVHIVMQEKYGNGLITYPGALFPTNFKEIEEFNHGGFYIVNLDQEVNIERIPIKLKEVLSFNIDSEDKTPEEVEKEFFEFIKDKGIKDKIITLRIAGTLRAGKPSDINFINIMRNLDEAYFVLKNTNKLFAKELNNIKVETGSVEEIEGKLIVEQTKDQEADFIDGNDNIFISSLIEALNKEKSEGERNIDFENRIIKEVFPLLKI